VYTNRSYRISKDTNGGFGTGNHFGSALIPRLLTAIKRRSVDFPPLYLPYVSAALKGFGHQVAYVRNAEPPGDSDLVLMPSSTVAHSEEVRRGRELKRRGFHVGFLGPVAGLLPEAYLDAGMFVVQGEPEAFFLDDPASANLHGLVQAPVLHDLDRLPLPDWSIIDAATLNYKLFGGKGPFYPLFASKGCPMRCGYYCTYPLQQGTAQRSMSPVRVVEVMAHLKDRYGAKKVMFRDPFFTLDKNRTMAFAHALRERNLGLSFTIETHLDTLTPDLVDALIQAGMTTVKIGVEGGIPEVLDAFGRKSRAMDLQMAAVRRLEKAGLQVIAFYILAMPDDTWESSLETIRYARQLNTAGAQFSVCTPFPGTRFYDEVKDAIQCNTLDDFTLFQLVFRHKNLSREQVETLKNIAYTSYYLRLPWLLKYLRSRLRG
jgi:radical SAM superfamily enzyme YgiQ (UPF0313 family)